MKKNKVLVSPKHELARRKPKQELPRGWNERKVRAVIRHYEQLSDDELASEIETAPEVTGESLISVPTKLLTAIREVILQHQKSA